MKPTVVPEKMFPSTVLASLLQAMKSLCPPGWVVHVGAGRGQGDLHTWHSWSVAHAVLIDADSKRLTWAYPRASTNGWHVVTATLAGHPGLADYHLASSPDEDSLVQPQRLQHWWPHLRARQAQARPTKTIDQVVNEVMGEVMSDVADQGQAGWLMIDCLPALELLSGGAQTLAHTQLVCVRVTQWGNRPDNEQNDDLSQAAITQHLASLGFTDVAYISGNHPDVGHAIYARNFAQNNTKLRADNAELTSTVDDLRKQRDAQAQATQDALMQRDAETQAKSEALFQLDVQVKAKVQACLRHDALIRENLALVAAYQEQTKMATGLQVALATLQTQHDKVVHEKSKLVADNQEITNVRAQVTLQRNLDTKDKIDVLAQLEAQTTATMEARDRCDALAKEKEVLYAALKEQTQLAADHQQAIAAIQTQHDELVHEKFKLIAANAELTLSQSHVVLQQDIQAKATSEALARCDALAQEKTTLTAAHGEQAKRVAALQTQCNDLIQENSKLIATNTDLTSAKAQLSTQCEAEAKAKTEALTRYDALAQDNARLMADQKELSQLASERQRSLIGQQQDASTLQQRNQQLEAHLHDNVIRQRLQDEELIKAEAQIELIKDLLLREPGDL